MVLGRGKRVRSPKCVVITGATAGIGEGLALHYAKPGVTLALTGRNGARLDAVAKACNRGETTRKDAAGVILYAAEKATWMALEAIQTLGGNGYINDYPTGRLLRDAKLYEIGAGTSEIRRMLIGRELFAETT